MSHVVANRYWCTTPLHRGRGNMGEVWEARDTYRNDRVVAVKILSPGSVLLLARARLEVEMLRRHVPGVVELYDDGVEGDRPYLVMERVYGDPFPGRPTPCAWSDLAGVTQALLVTLANVHAMFVVHRDLKPDNVLVTKDGQVKVLDFGLAYRTDAIADRLTEHVEILGTPRYMALEQVQGGPDKRSDLYAVGVMLYEALAGHPPFDGDTWYKMARAKQGLPLPLAQAAPGVPLAVAKVVHDLLSSDPNRRPRTASEVLHRLRGEVPVEEDDLHWLGPQDVPRALASAVRARRSVDLIGPRGAGRTRCLRALSRALGGERRVVALPPGSAAFESLSPIVGSLADHSQGTFAEVRALVEQQIREVLAGGAVILADDAEGIDPASVTVLDECRADGSVVCVLLGPGGDGGAGDGSLRLSPLDEGHLRALFAGPDRLLHLREDAARVLYQRTRGYPRRIAEEIKTWVQLGIAGWRRNLVVVHRGSFEALASGLLRAAPVDPKPDGTEWLSDALLDMLAWITLAWPHGDVALLAAASRQPRFRVEAHLAVLAGHRLVDQGPDGKIAVRTPFSATPRWTEERVRDAHHAIGRLLEKGTPGRLEHLLMRGARSEEEQREIAREAAALAEREIDEGRLELAMATAERGLRSVRDLGLLADLEVERLLSLWVEAAASSEQPQALDRVLYEIGRAEVVSAAREQLQELCQAALGVGNFMPARRDRLERFADPRLERVRLAVWGRAARHLRDTDAEEVELRAIELCLPAGDADAEAMLGNCRGSLRYRQGRFAEAAELHRGAAEKATQVLLRTYSRVAGSFAAMDDFDLVEARELATRAAEEARSLRHAVYETQAEWVLRTVAYRLGEAGEPDAELLDAAPYVGAKHPEALLLVNEAAVAYRLERMDEARRFAERAAEILAQLGAKQSGALARGLAIRAGAPATDEEIVRLRQDVKDALRGIDLQVLALLAMVGRLPPDGATADGVAALADAIPRDHWDTRMDVLSVNECVAELGKVTGSSAGCTAR